MTLAEDDNTAPSFRFKRRKTTHTKRARTDEDVAPVPGADTCDTATALDAPEAVQDENEPVPNLKEIIRNRKRPRNRVKDVARKPEAPHTELVQSEAPPRDQYTSRFVAQTGQVVDSSDKHMTAYVEARMAEQNHRQYGWPIPRHLQSAVAAIAPDLRHTFTPDSIQATAASSSTVVDTKHSPHVAASQGRLEEVSLDPSTSHTSKPAHDAPTSKPFPRRAPKRRPSDAIRRDQLVDAILREAKLDFFDADAAPATLPAPSDDDMLARFRAEYFESQEARAQRRPAPPVAKDAPKGPKLGGSRSARAAMRGLEDAAAAAKRQR